MVSVISAVLNKNNIVQQSHLHTYLLFVILKQKNSILVNCIFKQLHCENCLRIRGFQRKKRDRNKIPTKEAGMLSPDKNVIEGDEDEPVIEAHLRKIVFSENLQCIMVVFL
jgi:hypothetical protein